MNANIDDPCFPTGELEAIQARVNEVIELTGLA